MLLLFNSGYIDDHSITIKLKDLFLFIPIIKSPSDDEDEIKTGNRDTIIINYTFTRYISSLKLVPEIPQLIIGNDDGKKKLEATDWVLFTRGSLAGTGNSIKNLVFHRYHIENCSLYKFEAIANTIIIRTKEHVSVDIDPYFYDVLLECLLEAAHMYEDDNNSFLIKLILKDEPRKENYFIKLGELKELNIRIPGLEKQREIIERYKQIENMSEGNLNSIISTRGILKRDLIIELQTNIQLI
jgi:hypothetical protein